MPRLVIAPLAELPDAVARWSPSHVVSIGSPSSELPALDRPEHISLRFHDVVDETTSGPHLVHPSDVHAAAIIRAARDWDGHAPMLLHCQFAISRSPAAALIVRAVREPSCPGSELMAELRRAAPFATPNWRLLAVAEAELGRSDLARAARDAGRGAFASTGRTFVLETA